MGKSTKTIKEQIKDATKSMYDALAADLFEDPPHLRGLNKVLRGLGIRSAGRTDLTWGQSLQIESLETRMGNITFDASMLGKWPSTDK